MCMEISARTDSSKYKLPCSGHMQWAYAMYKSFSLITAGQILIPGRPALTMHRCGGAGSDLQASAGDITGSRAELVLRCLASESPESIQWHKWHR